MTRQPHFTALLSFAPDKIGEQQTPVSSGYRVVLHFPFLQKELIGILNFPSAELVFSGDSVMAEITLLEAGDFVQTLYEGLDFEFFAADQPIGSGVVKQVL